MRIRTGRRSSESDVDEETLAVTDELWNPTDDSCESDSADLSDHDDIDGENDDARDDSEDNPMLTATTDIM
jgi:hypothetical protein